jgi:hypothetical protein
MSGPSRDRDLARAIVRIVVAAAVVSAVVSAADPALAAAASSRCSRTGTTVASNASVRVFRKSRRIRLYPGPRTRVTNYYGCARAGGRIFRLRFPGGSAQGNPEEGVLSPRLADRYFALVIGYTEGPWMVAVWDLVARRNTYFGVLAEDVYPTDLELTPHGAVAWVSDLDGTVTKVDALGRTKLGTADQDAAACSEYGWCRSTLALDGDNLSWRERGVARSSPLQGRAIR